MEGRFEKKNNGHDVFINNQWLMWVIGSIKNAKKELEIYLKQD
tara:strand:+ start:52 stop:180 length:129 start_codon:yes stop_codon:yes gene_type:complete